jgi:cytochrome c
MGCHAVDRKVVGPSFQQIAAKYKGDAQAPAPVTNSSPAHPGNPAVSQ